jgi:hypothetical protein
VRRAAWRVSIAHCGLSFCCREVELKISQAVRKRVEVVSLTCRELGKVLSTRTASDLAVKNSYADMLTLVAEESATLFPAIIAMKEQFAAVAAAYGESALTLEQEGVAHAVTMKDSFAAQTQHAAKEVGSHVAELQAARALSQQCYAKQEKAMTVAFNPHGTVAVSDEAAAAQLAGNCDLDPWLSTVALEASIKGVETLAAKQQDAFQRGVNDVIDADDRRIEATKSLLLSFLQSEKKKLQAHLDAVESLFDCVQNINPSADAHSFLSQYNISEADLSRNKSKAVKAEGNESAQPPDMGVWVPDDSVKVCTQVRPRPRCSPVSFLCCRDLSLAQCAASFSMFKRKHHCRCPPPAPRRRPAPARPNKPLSRYCGRVFCADCTPHNVMLPVQFGYSDPQRVCQVLRSTFPLFTFVCVVLTVARGQSCATAVEAAKEHFPVDHVFLGESCKTEVIMCLVVARAARGSDAGGRSSSRRG